MRKLPKGRLLVAIIGAALVLFFLKNTPDNNDERNTSGRALMRAADFASAIALGHRIADDAIDVAADKLPHTAIPSIGDVAVIREFAGADGNGINTHYSYLWHPVLNYAAEPSRLLNLERMSQHNFFYVATYTIKTGASPADSSLLIDGKPLIISVVVRYVSNSSSPLARFFRKIANLGVMPDWIKAEGAGGDWYLSDFQFNGNLRSYYDWLLANRTRLYAEADARNARVLADMSSFNSQTILAEVTKQLDEGQQWSSHEMEAQASSVSANLASR